MVHAPFDQLLAAETQELSRLASDRDHLDDERPKLLQAHYAGAVPLEEQDRIGAQVANALNWLPKQRRRAKPKPIPER